MLTIAPPLAVLIMAGMAYLESRNMVSTLTCITRRYSSGFSSTTLPRLPMPTLLSRKSSRPQRSIAASTSRLQSASKVASQASATAVPPSASIISTVRSARPRSRSATSTLAPARASSIAAARPLPMPSPTAPPPLTMATLPVRPASSSGPCIALLSLGDFFAGFTLPASSGIKTSGIARQALRFIGAVPRHGIKADDRC